MKSGYPELEEHRNEIHRILSAEEERFGQTLVRGLRLFEEVAQRGGDIAGEDAFRLHDTYGFPLELTQELARERGLGVNDEEFTHLMEEQRERSRAAISRDDQRAVEFAQAAGFRSEFVGFEKTEVLTQVGAVEELGDGLFLAKLRESPFYAAGGGQVIDAGWIELDEDGGARAVLRDAYRLEDDQALLFEGEGFAAGARVKAVVPWGVRFPTMANHTATHLLHKALQDVLGDHVRQAGSAVRPDKLRFDFTHPQHLTTEERAEVERQVNERIFQNLPVRAYVTPIEEARKLGAMMLFGEKYGEHVRVIEIAGYSRELCGGTHVRSTAEIGPFAILSESSVGAGARRIEAVTSGEAYAYLHGGLREAERLRAELEHVRKEARKPRPEAAAEFSIVDKGDERRARRGEGAQGGRAPRPLRPRPTAGESCRGDRGLRRRRPRLSRREPRRVARRARPRRVEARTRSRPPYRRRWRGPADAGGGRREEPGGPARGARGRQASDHRRAEVKIVALDFGRARTGVAVSDPTGTVARPLCVVERAATEQGLERLAALIEQEEAERVVVGLPLTLRGERGEQARETEAFVASLATATDVPVVTFDERFTTDLAEQVPSQTAEDARAAAHLLTSYLTWSSGAPA